MVEGKKIVLPTVKLAPVRVNPRKLVMFGKPKCGKTTAVSGLDNALHLDLQNGTEFVTTMRVPITNLADLREVSRAIRESEHLYDYIIVDTITDLEELILPLAANMYKETPMGKSWSGKDVRTLPKGAGYLYMRKAFFAVLDDIYAWANNIILIGHLKDAFIEKKGEELTAIELDLTGKIKSMLSGDVDAIGYVYRKDNQTIINFNTTDEIICEARPAHLAGKQIVLAEKHEDGSITTNWDKIYI